MKLAVSNIAWSAAEDEAVLDLLAAQGVGEVEIAPTRLWPEWKGALPQAARDAGAAFAQRGFAVPALQSLLFGRPDLQVFGPPDNQARLLDHLAMVADLAAALGAKAMVFGSPRNRDRGDLDPATAAARAVEFFRRAGEVCAARGACLCIEPNPPVYGCNFLTRWAEAAELVERVAHPGIGLHLDTACIAMAGDDPAQAVRECRAITRHFHISEPQLGGFEQPAIDHARIGQALRETGYAGWSSIEMRRGERPMESVSQAVRHALSCYG